MKELRGNKEATIKFADPYNNLLYAILLQAVKDNDIDWIKHDDGAIIWSYLKKQPRRVERISRPVYYKNTRLRVDWR